MAKERPRPEQVPSAKPYLTFQPHNGLAAQFMPRDEIVKARCITASATARHGRRCKVGSGRKTQNVGREQSGHSLVTVLWVMA